jgi:hypothetical protein
LFSEASFNDFFVVSLQDLVVEGDGEFVVFEVNFVFDSVHEMGDLMLNFCKKFFVKLSFGVSVWKDGQQFGREENGCKVFFHKDNFVHLDGPEHIPKGGLIQHTFILILNALHVPQLNLLFETSEGFNQQCAVGVILVGGFGILTIVNLITVNIVGWIATAMAIDAMVFF